MLRGGLVAALLSGASGLALTHRLAAGRQSPRPIVCMAADAGGEAVAEKEEPAGPSPAELFGESSELGQIFGPTNPAHAWEKPWTNLETQEGVQVVKAHSRQLKDPLKADMADDEIFVSKDSIHILKHHGSYMQQDRSLKGKAKQESYQFMLRLKVPCGEVPGALYAELDDISNKWGHGDLRATTRQAFQLHGVLKSNLKSVIAAIANVGSNTYAARAIRRRAFFTNSPTPEPTRPPGTAAAATSRAT